MLFVSKSGMTAIWVVGVIGGISEMDGWVAKVVGEIFVTIGCVTDALGVSAFDETADSEVEAVGETLVVAQLVETWEMVGWEVESVGEISVIVGLVAEVVGEISAVIGWLSRYVETPATIW